MALPIQNKAFPIKRRKIEDTLVSWDSVTTADGNIGGGSLIDTGLIGSNDFITNQVTVIILGGAANLERQLCTAFNPATGEIDFSPLSAQIVAGTPYRLTGLMSPEVSVAGLAAALAVPLPDSVANLLMRDVVGNKTDTPVSSVSATASLTAYIKGIVNSANGTGKIYFGITVPAAGSMTIDNDVLCIGDINIGAGGTLSINGDCHCVGSIAVGTNLGGGAALTVNGDLHCTTAIYNWDLSGISITGDCYGAGITNTTGQVGIGGNYNVGPGVSTVSNTSGRFNIQGDFNGPSAQITQLDPTANGDFYINGDCTVNSIETSGADTFEIYGNLYCSGVTLDAPAGSLTVDGNANLSSGLNCSQDGVDFDVLGDCSIFSAVTLGGGTSGTINVYGKLTAKSGIVTHAGSTINTGELESGSSVTVEGTATFYGDVKIPGGSLLNNGIAPVSIVGDLKVYPGMGGVMNSNAGTITILGNCDIDGHVSNTGVGSISVGLDLKCAGVDASITGIAVGGNAYIYGDLPIGNNMTFSVQGNLICSGAFMANADGVTIAIYGDCKVDGTLSLGGGTSGSMTVSGNLSANGDVAVAAGASLTVVALQCAGAISNTGTLTVMGELTSQSSITVADGATLQASATIISISDFVINGVVTIYGNLTVSEGNVTVGSGKSILAVAGDLFVGIALTNATGFINVLGKCTINALIQTDAGSILIAGDLRTASNLENNGAGTIQIEGDCFVAGHFQNLAGGSISIDGALQCAGAISNTGILTTGPLTCNSDITNSGTITSNGGILYVGAYTNTGTVNNYMYKSP